VAEQAKSEEKDISDQISDLKEELEKHFKRVKNPNDTFKESLTPLKKLALFVTEHVGTMGFFFIVLGWTLFWLAFNIVVPKSVRFDPYPAFVLWLIISNILQILLMPLLLIGQNIQGMRADIRGEHDYETDQRAEKEIKTVLLHFDRQQKLILKILESIEALSEGRKPEEGTADK
jgi:uncharacterized membrane protein